MRIGAAALVLCFAAFAQNPPADVDEALRARVNEFYGYHVQGEFEKAWPMVAEDTKKEYFNAQKVRYESYKIDSIKYSDNFTKAVVTLTVTEKKRMSVQMPEITMTHPSSTLWKIENGKWCWYNDHSSNWMIPMGPSDPAAVKAANNSGQAINPMVTPDALKQRVAAIMGQSAFDKTVLRLGGTQESSDQAVFHNGQGGGIRIALAQTNLPEGMTAKLDKTELAADDRATLRVTYNPKTQKDKVPGDVTLYVIMEPFAQQFPVVVKFSPIQ